MMLMFDVMMIEQKIATMSSNPPNAQWQ